MTEKNNTGQKRIGIFGGSYNPPHIAHSIVAESVRQQIQLEKILFIPSGNHPLKESIDAEKRLEMAKIAFGNDANFEVSDIEVKRKNEKSYTVNTLQKLNENYKHDNVKIFLIIGADNLIELPKWKEPEKLFELCEVIVINRPDYNIRDSRSEYLGKVNFVTVPYLEISSSMIRQLVSLNRSVRYLVSEGVEEYIFKNKLYV